MNGVSFSFSSVSLWAVIVSTGSRCSDIDVMSDPIAWTEVIWDRRCLPWYLALLCIASKVLSWGQERRPAQNPSDGIWCLTCRSLWQMLLLLGCRSLRCVHRNNTEQGLLWGPRFFVAFPCLLRARNLQTTMGAICPKRLRNKPPVFCHHQLEQWHSLHYLFSKVCLAMSPCGLLSFLHEWPAKNIIPSQET